MKLKCSQKERKQLTSNFRHLSLSHFLEEKRQLCPLAVPDFVMRLGAPHKIDRYANRCSLYPPQAAVAYVARQREPVSDRGEPCPYGRTLHINCQHSIKIPEISDESRGKLFIKLCYVSEPRYMSECSLRQRLKRCRRSSYPPPTPAYRQALKAPPHNEV